MFCIEEAAQLRWLNRKSKELGAQTVVIGNGSPAAAAAFHDGLLEGEVRLLTDPDLTSYKALELKRSLFASFQPRTFLQGFKLSRRGIRGTKVEGDSLQQGGAFVITPDHQVPYIYFCKRPEDHARPEDILEALRKIQGQDWGWRA